MKVSIEVTKSPRGYLKPNAEVSGWLTLANVKDKSEELEKISIALMELWWDQGVDIGPSDYKNVHDEKVIFKKSKQVSKVVFKPGEKKRWEFTFKLPQSWSCSDFQRFRNVGSLSGSWRISIVGIASRGKLRNDVVELVAPVEGTKVKPMWFFEPDKGIKGAGGAGGSGAVFERPSSVGTFSVIPKGQKATLQLAKGDEEGEFLVSFQTPGVVRGSNEFSQKVDIELLGRMMEKLEKVASALNVVRGLDADDPSRAKTEKAHESLRKIGNALYNQMIPRTVQDALKQLKIALDFGLDESVVSYPWEL
ncbi:MAG TPA: hypothetical protein VKK79_02410, partial [Candidatus Lokiarchaeia archaeon]|nr:hypothetical protein [Candidatus Lokiarchaeia archaeon]